MRSYRAVLIVSLALGAALLVLSRRRYRTAALPAVRTRQMAPDDIEMWTEYLEAVESSAAKEAVQTWARKHNVGRVRMVSRTRDRMKVAFERRSTGPGLEVPPDAGSVPTPAQKCRAIFEGQGMWKGVLSNYKITCICACKKDPRTGEFHCTEDPRDCTFEFTRA